MKRTAVKRAKPKRKETAPVTPDSSLAKYGKPDIANTAQGSQFTPEDSTDVVNATKIFKPSLDDKGASRDNVFP